MLQQGCYQTVFLTDEGRSVCWRWLVTEGHGEKTAFVELGHLLEGFSQLKATLLGGRQENKHPNRLKLSTRKGKITAYGPITSWQIDGEKVEIVTDFIFLAFKITVDSDCSHEIKRCLLLRRKAETNLDSILKSKGVTLLTKICVFKAVVFPVVMYGCESWIIKKAEHQRIDVFELWCWRRHLRVPWTGRRSNWSILKKISPVFPWKDWCWSWSSNTLATWREEPAHWKTHWC